MDWRFSFFLLAMLGLLLGFSWSTSEGGLCSAPYVVKMLAEPSKDGALNCFDFWFNRYQSFISAILSLISAFAAAYLVWRQIEGMYAANEISRRAQAVSQYESVQRRYMALRSAGRFGNEVQIIAKTAGRLASLVRDGGIDDAEVSDHIVQLIDHCDRSLALAEKLKENLDCGPRFGNEILHMEFDCDAIKMTAREYDGRDGGLLEVGSKEHFHTMLGMGAQTMMDHSITYFRWSINEIRRLQKLMSDLDDIIIR